MIAKLLDRFRDDLVRRSRISEIGLDGDDGRGTIAEPLDLWESGTQTFLTTSRAAIPYLCSIFCKLEYYALPDPAETPGNNSYSTA
ncbi:hypothetical protein BBP40_003359 [Aspergillus hancockii]|nr:hypothetical protein BBP40_003359 [Aspergillus hancockii]